LVTLRFLILYMPVLSVALGEPPTIPCVTSGGTNSRKRLTYSTPPNLLDNIACLYSLVEKRVYKLTLPEPPIRTRFLVGSSNG